MKRIVLALCFASLLSCDESTDKSVSYPVLRASLACSKEPSEMRWIQDLIDESKKDLTLTASLYLSRLNGEPVFVHQPMVMSCWACIIYDCNGERINREMLDQADLTEIGDGMRAIYNPY